MTTAPQPPAWETPPSWEGAARTTTPKPPAWGTPIPPPLSWDAPADSDKSIVSQTANVPLPQPTSFTAKPNVPLLNTADAPLNPDDPNEFRELGPMTADKALELWEKEKLTLAPIKAREMLLRKFVARAFFTKPNEGTNKQELGAGYQLVAKIVLGYKLVADPSLPEGTPLDECVQRVIDELGQIGNEGSFIADAVFEWEAKLIVGEYKKLVERAKTSDLALAMLRVVNRVVRIDTGAPQLEIREPR